MEQELVTGLRVFVSYRRADTQSHDNGLSDGLRRRLPGSRVFMDLDDIPIGVDFVEHIRGEIRQCHVVLVLIGQDWLNSHVEANARRLDDPADFVRLEIESSLTHPNVVVVPVLVEGARMPAAAQLPAPLSKLARLQSFTLDDEEWTFGLDRLSSGIRHLWAQQAELEPHESPPGPATAARLVDIAPQAVRQAVATLPATFQTKDVSEHPTVRSAHQTLLEARNYHATVGAWLSRNAAELGLQAAGKGPGGRGQIWRRAPRPGGSSIPVST